MTLLFGFIAALFTTVVLIPALMRGAPGLHLLDMPGARKLHKIPIPRCGGIAIAVGTMLPLLMWAPLDRALVSYLVAALILLATGLWDDFRPLHYKWKLLGQAVAVAVAMQGGVLIEHVPLFGLDPAPLWVTYPLTALFLLGVTNAVNLFDGLDGLAGGCVLLTLGTFALLAYESDGYTYALMAVAVMGSVFGFLRYNTHPASVFMGDSGSHFLGFTTAALAIFLIEKSHAAISPAVPLFLVGLPILDTLMVAGQRILTGRSPFSADRNHTHHKLLGLSFTHYEAVALIYVVQALLVCSAYLLRYESDALVLAAFTAIYAAIITALFSAQAFGWRAHPPGVPGHFTERRNLWLRRWAGLPKFSLGYVRYAVAGFLVIGALVPVDISTDVSVLALGIAGLSLAAAIILKSHSRLLERLCVYVAAALIAYLFASWHAANPAIQWPLILYLVALTVILVVAIRVTRRDLFQVTTEDLLILFLVLVLPNISRETLTQYRLGEVALMVIVLFYASEFLLMRDASGYRLVRLAALVSLSVVGFRGLLA